MLAWLEQLLIRYPELALFLVIAAGYWIGNLRSSTIVVITGANCSGRLQALPLILGWSSKSRYAPPRMNQSILHGDHQSRLLASQKSYLITKDR